MKRIAVIMALFLALTELHAQYYWKNNTAPGKLELAKGLEYRVEMQGSVSKGKTPLWLNANKYGLSSLEQTNGYLRAAVIRPLSVDSARRWAIGYGLDLAGTWHYTSKPIVQQAYGELRWLHGLLTVGSKEYPMELKNNSLSSGAQTLGINARPVPQVRLALPEYWTLPLLYGWLHLKGHIAYGKFTDNSWKTEFTRTSKAPYATGALYHSKAGYLKIENRRQEYPFSFEMGLEMVSQFGGTRHAYDENGNLTITQAPHGLRSFWDAFIPGGAGVGETTYQNVEGNQLGSYVVRFNWDSSGWGFSLYGDHFFEDHSQMLFLDYDGYGTGEEWNTKKDRRYVSYGLRDFMVGAELRLPRHRWLDNAVFEFITTKYQSGPVYHDRTPTISDHIGGRDSYYNHWWYNGYMHWGQVMGNPLYRSPLYNTDGFILVENNRFVAWHVGFSGHPYRNMGYRMLATYQNGWGDYDRPFTHKQHNVSLMAEMHYRFSLPKWGNWMVKGAAGADFGEILGDNYGVQFTLTKYGLFKR